MQTEFIESRRYVEFRTDQEEHDTIILVEMLKKSFLYSNITIHWGSKIEISENNNTSFLIIADDLIFRSPLYADHDDIIITETNASKPNELLLTTIESAIDFFNEYRKKNDLQWYLPENPRIYSPKNRELFPYFGDFKLEKFSSFHKAFPAASRWDNRRRGNWNYLLFRNIVSIEKLKSCLVSRIKFNEWIYSLVIIFKGKFLMGDYLVNQNEGVGFHLLEKCLMITGYNYF